ncbi:PAS domain-containing sensor histidine kinase [Bacteroidota bacterium]
MLFIEELKNMIYKKFRLALIVRLSLILFNLTGLAFVIVNTTLQNWIFTIIALLMLAIFQTYSLMRFVNKTNRDYAKFLTSVKNGDFISNFHTKFDDSGYKDFYSSLSEVFEIFQKVKIEKEAQFQYLRQIMRQLNVGVIAFDPDGVIEVMNLMATRLLRITKVDHWDKLKIKTPVFYNLINSISKKDKRLVDIVIKGEKKQFFIEVNTISLLELPHKIITFQNIKSEVEAKEIEAWHKLIRTMAHEIMNSLTPITSLTETSIMLLQNEGGYQKKPAEFTKKTISNLVVALKTIESRTNGLLGFISNYRKLTRIALPKPEKLGIDELFEKIETLMRREAEKYKAGINYHILHSEMFINADGGQIEQVLINLLTNSFSAIKQTKKPEIKVLAYNNEDGVTIEVTDNGNGIEPDKIDKIFIPFFSTKPQGTGIGLSLSKQIIKNHKGDIEVKSIPGEKTSVYVHFPN